MKQLSDEDRSQLVHDIKEATTITREGLGGGWSSDVWLAILPEVFKVIRLKSVRERPSNYEY